MTDKDTTKAPVTVEVRVSSATRPGLKLVGDYVVDQVYLVPCREAARLVAVKGFEYVNPKDAKVCELAIAEEDEAAEAAAKRAAAKAKREENKLHALRDRTLPDIFEELDELTPDELRELRALEALEDPPRSTLLARLDSKIQAMETAAPAVEGQPATAPQE